MFDSAFAQIAAILTLAVAFGALTKFLRQPVVVAYILVGVVIGPSMLGLIHSDESLELLAEVGITILLFLVGLKLDLGLIRTTGPVAVAAGLFQVAVTAGLSLLVALAFGFGLEAGLFIAVAMAFSSTIIIVKLLSDKREIDELYGRIAVGILIVQDVVVIIALIVVTAIGEPSGDSLAVSLGQTVLAGAALIVGLVLLSRYVLPPMLDWLARSQELLLLFGVGWATAIAALGEVLGLGMEIGAFLAGVSLASTAYRETIGARLVTLRDIMLLFFFIELGTLLTFDNALSQLLPALLLSLVVIVVKPVSVMAAMGVLGYHKRVSFRTGLTLAQISEFSLILVALGLTLGQVDEQVLSLVTLVAVFTITGSTYLIMYSDQIYHRLAPRLSFFERTSLTEVYDEPIKQFPIDAIVVGAGRLGGAVIDGLRANGEELLVVDFNPVALKSVRGPGVETLYGDVSEPEFAAALPIHEADQIICAIPDLPTNLMVRENLRRLGYEGNLCLTAMDDQSAKLLKGGDRTSVIRPFRVAARSIVDQISAPDEDPDEDSESGERL